MLMPMSLLIYTYVYACPYVYGHNLDMSNRCPWHVPLPCLITISVAVSVSELTAADSWFLCYRSCQQISMTAHHLHLGSQVTSFLSYCHHSIYSNVYVMFICLWDYLMTNTCSKSTSDPQGALVLVPRMPEEVFSLRSFLLVGSNANIISAHFYITRHFILAVYDLIFLDSSYTAFNTHSTA